jgi:hypothetical protein
MSTLPSLPKLLLPPICNRLRNKVIVFILSCNHHQIITVNSLLFGTCGKWGMPKAGQKPNTKSE